MTSGPHDNADHPTGGPFGAAVEKLDVSAPLDDATARELVDALFEHRILLLGDQQPTEAEYSRFGRLWGDPLLFFVPQHRHGAFPRSSGSATPPRPRRRAGTARCTGTPTAPTKTVPASVTMLYGIEAPRTGNGTEFADMVAAAFKAGTMAGGERRRLVEEEQLRVAVPEHLPRRGP